MLYNIYLQYTNTDQSILIDQKGLEEYSKYLVALYSIRLFKSKGETITIFFKVSNSIQRKKVLFFANILSLYSYTYKVYSYPVYLGCFSLSQNYITLDLELYNYFIQSLQLSCLFRLLFSSQDTIQHQYSQLLTIPIL